MATVALARQRIGGGDAAAAAARRLQRQRCGGSAAAGRRRYCGGGVSVAAALARRKVCFLSDYLCFLFGRCVESTRTDTSYPPIYYFPMLLKSSSCFGMILDKGGGGAPRSGCRWRRQGGRGT